MLRKLTWLVTIIFLVSLVHGQILATFGTSFSWMTFNNATPTYRQLDKTYYAWQVKIINQLMYNESTWKTAKIRLSNASLEDIDLVDICYTKRGFVDVWIGKEIHGVPSTVILASFPWSAGEEIYYTLNSSGYLIIGNKSNSQNYLQGYLLGNFPLEYVGGLGEPNTAIAGFVSVEISEPIAPTPTISYGLIILTIHVISAISIIALLLGIFTQLRRNRKVGNRTVVACFLFTILLISSSLILVITLVKEQQYFFFQDADFWNDSDALVVKWLGRNWNFSALGNGNYANITFGMAWLRFNESSGQDWAGAILLQGFHPHGGGNWYELLGGKNADEAKPVDGVTFYNDSKIPEGKFLLRTRVMLLERQYTTLVVNKTKEKSGLPVGNVGVDLMFSYEYLDNNSELHLSTYDDEDPKKGGAIHADVLLSRFTYDDRGNLNHTRIGPEGDSVNNSTYDYDFHISLVRNQINNVGTWHELEVDIGEVINRIFELPLKRDDIKKIVSITARGAQVYVDGIGVVIEARIDYIRIVV